MASPFAIRFAEALARPGERNLMAIFERVERGTVSDRDLTEYREFITAFREWRAQNAPPTSACQPAPSVVA